MHGGKFGYNSKTRGYPGKEGEQYHPYDRKSGTGRGKEIKKGGFGKGNWGKDDKPVDEENEKNEESKNEETNEEAQEPKEAKEGSEQEEEEEEEDIMTYEDYKNQKKERSDVLQVKGKSLI